MKKSVILAPVLGLLLLVAPSSGIAAEGPKAKIFAKYDLNKNGVIDGEEVAAVRKAFSADPKGEFAGYDLNKDGKLDDAEIAAIKPPGAKKGGAKQGGKREKDSATPPSAK